jgi:drug/metabolite transporter (DMT)-like permease
MDFIRNGVFIAILAHGLIGISLLWDKVLLQQAGTRNLLSYVFWMGAISIFGLVLIPFGFQMPTLSTAVIAMVAGALQLAAVFFYYAALKFGEASQALAIMGGFSPVATALIGMALLRNPLGRGNLLAFTLMTLGGFVMFFSERFRFHKILPSVIAASALFGLVNVMQKVVFNHTNFVTGYVFFTIGTFAGSLLLLIRPGWRRQIFAKSSQSKPRSRLLYFVNRFAGGLGSFLVYYAISLENPAVVDAITGVRYAIIFVGAFLLTRMKSKWLKEDFSGWTLVGKTAGTLLIVTGLVIMGLKGGSAIGNIFHHSVGAGHARPRLAPSDSSET